MEVAGRGSTAVLAEKPSVARDIARTLGATQAGEGYLHGNEFVVTWAIGHLVALPEPHQIDPSWKQWRRETLPMLPQNWPLVIYDKTRDQFEVVRKILNSPRIASVVCATDAGREGELIFRYIYEAAHCEKPVRRLWISSLTPEAIRKGFESLRSGGDYDPLANAARGRSRADWLVGMNLSRAYSLAYNEELSVGRVQTPTLAMLVERELAIRNFVPEDYLEVRATFHPRGRADESKYVGTWFRMEGNRRTTRLPVDGLAPDENDAKAIVDRARTGIATIESMDSETQRMLPPLLYDLTELQRDANRLFGFSAQKTLDLSQSLYERYKLLSYPRTDSRHLSHDVAGTLPQIVRTIEAPYHELCAPGTGERPLGRRFVDDAKISDHHAIIPTTTPPDRVQLSPDESRIYDLVCRRLLSAWHNDYIAAVTAVITAISNAGQVDRYHTAGTRIQQLGWKALERPSEKKTAARSRGTKESEEDEAVSTLPPDLAVGQAQDVINAQVQKKSTKPPKRLMEGALLTAMETAGKSLEQKELSNAMNESGLGTPATRAAIIEVLLKRGYIERNGKSLEATDKGIRLIEVVHPEVKSPAMTGQWEAYLQSIHKGSAQLEPFLSGIEEYVRNVVAKVARRTGEQLLDETRASAPANGAGPHFKASVPVMSSEPVFAAAADETLQGLLQRAFGFSSFRTNQEPVCRAVIDGQDVLLVMPTGSGKSLCYQLPALARGGTTLVVSPLIALMEDQASKLGALGFSVARIHSGLERTASRKACVDYLNGSLHFLFIAPERLRVVGFPEMLAKRKPSLIAIDEAHCISQWGHDFRPDYRKLSQYLPALRPAPVMALTATATPVVQDDIVRQLGLEKPSRFIHGFRRENLAIEVVELAMGTRKQRQRQEELWVATATLACPASHPFYERLNRLLDECQFDDFVERLCKPFYAETLGRRGLAPGIYFRLLMVGYFEGIDSERGIAWRAADSLGLRKFLRIALDEAVPDHSTISRTRRLMDEETHRLVFVWLLEVLAERGLLRGHTIGIDATTLEANAALRTIVRRDTGEQYEEFLRRLAEESGIETPTRAQLAKLDKKRARKGSNEDWTHPHDPDARITRMKDGRTHLAHKAEHAVDMESGAVVAITVQPADAGDTHTLEQTLAEAQENIAVLAEVIDSEPNAPAVKVESPAELVTDKGYHSREVVRQVAEAGIRSYVSEPERGRQRWQDQSAEQAAVYGNRRRVRGERGKRLQRQRGEKLERTMAHLYETGGMRRVHLRGHSNIIKRLLIHACGLNLGLLMRKLYGVGTPRGLQNGGFDQVFAFLLLGGPYSMMDSEEIATLQVTSRQDETSICHTFSCPHICAWFLNFLNSLIFASGC